MYVKSSLVVQFSRHDRLGGFHNVNSTVDLPLHRHVLGAIWLIELYLINVGTRLAVRLEYYIFEFSYQMYKCILDRSVVVQTVAPKYLSAQGSFHRAQPASQLRMGKALVLHRARPVWRFGAVGSL